LPTGEDADFTDHVAGLEEVVGPYRPEDLTIVARHSYELATNWKVIAENYQECYHCSAPRPCH
jgi:Rieske 2Fe-2S family protein